MLDDQMTDMWSFPELAGREPWPGIFFIREPGCVCRLGKRVFGLAFMIRKDGLLATCAHVPIFRKLSFGDKLEVYSASAPIKLHAQFVEDGYLGVDPSDPAIDNYDPDSMIPPSAWSVDLAFLQLIPESVVHDGLRLPEVDGRAAAAMLRERVCYLPLGSPCYPPGTSISVRAHHVSWSASRRSGSEVSEPEFDTTNAELSGLTWRDGIRTVHVESEHLSRGDSGGPIWDPLRRRVVAMVRRGMPIDGDTELGADPRDIGGQVGVSMSIDADSKRIIDSLVSVAKATSLERHFPLLRSLVHGAFVDLDVAQPADTTAGLGERNRQRIGSAIPSILTNLEDNRCLVLLGGAGAGKSTLLYRLSRHLLNLKTYRRGKLLIPLIYHAKDFETHGFDLRAMVDSAARRTDLSLDTGRDPLEVFAVNDLSLLVIIDGLDEISTPARMRLFAILKSLIKTADLMHLGAAELQNDDIAFVVACRPVDDIKFIFRGTALGGIPVLELERLDEEQVHAIVSSTLQDSAKEAAFAELLKALTLTHDGATPLQVAMALELISNAEVLQEVGSIRPIDMTFRLLDHLIATGWDEDADRPIDDLGRTKAQKRLAANARELLQTIAENYLDGARTLEANCQRKNFFVAGKPVQAPEVRDFVNSEHRRLLGGILSFDDTSTGTHELIWPHRTVVEALSAEAAAIRCGEDRNAARKTFRESTLHRGGQGFVLHLLSRFDGSHGSFDHASDLIALKLEQEHMSPATMAFAISVLAAGIQAETPIKNRLVEMLVKFLMAPEDNPWTQKCLNAVSMVDMPDPFKVVRLAGVRPLVIGRLGNLFAKRARLSGVARVTVSEIKLVDHLSARHEIEVPIRWPEVAVNEPPLRPLSTQSLDFGRMRPGEEQSATIGEASFKFAMKLLERDQDRFLDAFAKFLSSQSGDTEPQLLIQEFLRSYITSDRSELRRG